MSFIERCPVLGDSTVSTYTPGRTLAGRWSISCRVHGSYLMFEANSRSFLIDFVSIFHGALMMSY